jgi:hypothetical protein
MADYPHVLDFNDYPGLKVTGQTTSYVTGDDGELQIGVPASYTLLSTGQYSGSTNITVNAKVEALSNNVAIDNVTGLMWTRERSDQIGPTSSGALLWTDAVNNETPFEYMTQANAASYAGHTDWRVPNAAELFSLMKMEGPSPYIDTTVFNNLAGLYGTWSSSTYKTTTTNAYYAAWSTGSLINAAKTNLFPAFLVRG